MWNPETNIRGPTGPPGAASTVPGPPGPPGADSAVPGPPGPPGEIEEAPEDGKLYARQDGEWIEIETGGASVILSDTPPVGAEPGSIWVETDTGLMYVRYNDGSSQQWFAVSGATSGGPAGQQGPAGPQGEPGADSTVPGPQGPAGPTKKNYVVNGAMMASQENGVNAANSTTTAYYPVDQFTQLVNTTGVFTLHQNATATPAGSPNRARLIVTTVDASIAASEYAVFLTRLEGYRVADLAFGTAGAKTVTLQFGVRAPAGTYCVCLRNAALNRNFVREYVITAGEANTDVVKSATFPGDTSGTWLKNNGIGIEIVWTLMAGINHHVAAGIWLNSGSFATANQFNWLGTNTNVFDLFDVSLNEGSVAPPFVVPDYASELSLCQRYWYRLQTAIVSGYSTAGGGHYTSYEHPCSMRIAPAVTYSGQSYSNASALTFNSSSTTSMMGRIVITATGNGYCVHDASVNARMV